jgi:FkbM family methyltransferase
MNACVQHDRVQLPALCHGPWLSRLLVRGYRDVEFPGRLRVLRWLHMFAGGRRIVVPICTGALMAIDSRDVIQRQLLYAGTYEPEVTDLFRNELRPGDQFLDVGANVGYFSMLALSCGAEVIAIEPDPLSAAVWRLNCRLNDGGVRAQLHECGLGEHQETLMFHRTEVANVGRSGFKTQDSVESLRVQVRRLDDLSVTCGLRAGGVWKLDVEGFEPEVLRGAQEALRVFAPRLVLFEADSREVDASPFELLEAHDFEVRHLPRYSGEVDVKENYIARLRSL